VGFHLSRLTFGADWRRQPPAGQPEVRAVAYIKGIGKLIAIVARFGTLYDSSKSLRKLIRKTSTGAFLTHRAEWTDDVREAETFATEDAVKFARRRFQLDGCELYYSFSKEKATEYDFSIPLWG